MSVGPWFQPGNIVRVAVPREHVVGHEQADNEVGPRPWIIVSSKFTSKTGIFFGILMTSTESRSVTQVPIANGDVEPLGPSPCVGSGCALLEQTRALSVDRADPTPCGRLNRAKLGQLQGEVATLLEGLSGAGGRQARG